MIRCAQAISWVESLVKELPLLMPVTFPPGAGCKSASTIPVDAVVVTAAPFGVALAVWLLNCPTPSTTAALAISQMYTSEVSVVLGVIVTVVTPALIPAAYQMSFQAPLPLSVLTERAPGT